MSRLNPDDSTHKLTGKCPYCGFQFEATTGMNHASSDPNIAIAMQMIKSRHSGKYEDVLDVMAVKVKEWKAQHMDLDISIQYNFPDNTAVIGTLQDGINSKFITVNDHAMQMFKELGWMDDTPAMPTIMMVRCTLEHVFGKDE